MVKFMPIIKTDFSLHKMTLNSKLKHLCKLRAYKRKQFILHFFLDFEQGDWHVNFALGPTNYVLYMCWQTS